MAFSIEQLRKDASGSSEEEDRSIKKLRKPETKTKPKGEGFFRGELTGGADTSEFTGFKKLGADIFRSTLGSRGLLGVAQQPAKVFGSVGASKDIEELDRLKSKSSSLAKTIVQKMSEASSPEEMKRLMSINEGLQDSMQQLDKAKKGLIKFTPTVKENIATSINALATVAPVGRFKDASLARKGLTTGAEATRGLTFAGASALEGDRLPEGRELLTGGAIGGAVPVVGRALGAVAGKVAGVAKNVATRLASGLGVSVDDIFANSLVAQKTARSLVSKEESVESILRKNSENLLSDVQTFRRDLRSDFGNALESLSKEQIDVGDVRNAAVSALNKNGITVSKTGFNAEGAEFSAPAIVKRAEAIINEINEISSFDGKTLRNIISKIDSKKFKTTGSDPDRLAFNAFMNDLDSGISKAVAQNTPQLQQANAAFSEGMQFVDVMQQEFGTIKFGNLKELNTFSKKLEGLLKKKGIAPEIIDDFLVKTGQDPTALRAQEAVRSVFAEQPVAEAAGITPFEFVRQVTAGILDPEDVARITIMLARASDVSEATIKPFVEKLAILTPVERIAIIKGLIESNEE